MINMSDVLNENKADQIVIMNLMKEVQRLKGNQKMGKILMDAEGQLYHAEVFEAIADSAVLGKIEQAKNEIAEFEAIKAKADSLQGQTTEQPASTPAPVEEAPAVEQPQPVVDQQPAAPVEAPVEQPAAQPEVQAQPEQPAQDAAAPVTPIIIQ